MRINKTTFTVAELSGLFGKGFVIRNVRGKAFLCKGPDRRNVKYTQAQKDQQERFKEAVKFAKSFFGHSAKKPGFKVKKGQSVYNAAISYYLKKHKR